MGMNTPLMKTSGNLTRFVIIIMLEGRFVGGVENSNPRYEEQNADNRIAAARTAGLKMRIPTMNPRASGTRDMITPKMNDDKASPRRIAGIEMGAEINRSSVLSLPSQGRMTGETAVAVKKSVMLRSPERRKSRDIPLPRKKARNRNMGKKNAIDEHWPFQIVNSDILLRYRKSSADLAS